MKSPMAPGMMDRRRKARFFLPDQPPIMAEEEGKEQCCHRLEGVLG